MTGAQRSYLKTLCEEPRVEFDEHLTKAEASRRIDELQHVTGRGLERKGERPGDGLARPERAGGAVEGAVGRAGVAGEEPEFVGVEVEFLGGGLPGQAVGPEVRGADQERLTGGG